MTTTNPAPVAGGARRGQHLLDAYAAGHRHPTNIAIHAVAVPMIAWSGLALISRLPFPAAIDFGSDLGWSTYAVLGCLVYYKQRFSSALVWAMTVFGFGMLTLVWLYPDDAAIRLSAFAIAVFAAAWALQLRGHRFEGNRPAFFHDAQFLLVGPAWVATHVLDALRIRY